MKRFTKICLISALVVFVLSIGCFIVGTILGGNPIRVVKNALNQGIFLEEQYGKNFDEDLLAERDLTLQKELDGENIQRLDVSVGYGAVVLRSVSSESVSVWVKDMEDEKHRVRVEEKDGTLSIVDESFDNDFSGNFLLWKSQWWKDQERMMIVVELPQKQYQSLKGYVQLGALKCYDMETEKASFHVEAGVVYTDGTLTCDSADVMVEMGEAALDDLQCRVLNVNVEMGDANVSSVSCDEITADVEMGNIEFRQAQAKHTKADCEMGNITLRMAGKPEDYYIISDVEMGDISVEKHEKTKDRTAAYRMELDCEMGDIDVSFVQ